MTLRVLTGCAPAMLFQNPVRVWASETFDDALRALHEADAALDEGYWIAGGLSYEFGAQQYGIRARSTSPLLVLGAFNHPQSYQSGEDRAFAISAPLARVSPPGYSSAIETIVASIYEGEVYQVNYTLPFDLGFSGDPCALYEFLCAGAGVGYSAYLEFENRAVASISPELFLQFSGGFVTAKPMKGTAPLDRIDDLSGEKNRAEHLMIVDLLRNDLHRVCTQVTVDPLFSLERYPTFATMTSTVRGKLRADATFASIIEATFPCGSVTGAPKRAAIEHIARIEKYPRGFYTGTIGFLSPKREGWWNVPIRTLQMDLACSRARFDAGGGIVADSTAAEEWDEILLKSRFLRKACDRFSLWESFSSAVPAEGAMQHIARLNDAALRFNLPFDPVELRERLEAVPAQPEQFVRVRVYQDRITVTSEPLEPSQTPVEVCYSAAKVRSDDPLLRYKTGWRPIHEAAAREAADRACFDAILCNERGEITEGARTNVFAQFGDALYTPPLECGVLPGILRSQLVSQGHAMERVLTQADLITADAVFVGNSARGLLRARIK